MAASPSSSAPVSLWFPSARATRRPTAIDRHRPLGTGPRSLLQPRGSQRAIFAAGEHRPARHLESGSVAGSIMRSRPLVLRRRLVERTCRPGALARRCRLSGESRLSRLGGVIEESYTVGARRSLAVACGRLTSLTRSALLPHNRGSSEANQGKSHPEIELSKSGKYRGPHPATAIPCREGEEGAETVSSECMKSTTTMAEKKLTARLLCRGSPARRSCFSSRRWWFTAVPALLCTFPAAWHNVHTAAESTHAHIPAPSRSIRKEADPNSGHPSRASLADKSATRQQTWNNGGNSLTIATKERASLFFPSQLANRGVLWSWSMAPSIASFPRPAGSFFP